MLTVHAKINGQLPNVLINITLGSVHDAQSESYKMVRVLLSYVSTGWSVGGSALVLCQEKLASSDRWRLSHNHH